MSSDRTDDVVGPDGGTLVFEGGDVQLTFPAGAVAGDLQVTVTPVSGPGGPLAVPGAAWELGPDGTVFAEAVTLRLSYDPSALPQGVRAPELGVYRAEAGEWRPVDGSTVNTGAGTVAAPILGFSIYGVAAAPVAAVAVVPDPAGVEPGATVELEARPTSVAGLELPDRPVEWSSGDDQVATVDADGVVTGVAEGSTTITATVQGVSGSAVVTVRRVVAEVVVEPAAAEVGVGQTVSLSATPRAADGTVLERPVVWSEDDPAVATVDDQGVVTGVTQGETTIRATSEGVEGTATVAVTNPVTSVEVSADVQGIVAGGSTSLTVVLRDASGAEVTGREVSWSTSDETVAAVAADGTVTTLVPGVVTLTASAEGVEGSVALTVTIDWTEFAGSWSGSWTNTTFGSSDAVDATITIDVATLSAVIILDVDGPVFGQQDPMPMTITGTLTPTTLEVDYDAPLHGRVAFDLAPGDFDLESESVPAAGIDGWTYSGTNTATTHTGDFTVQFSGGGGSAQGVVTVTKQN